MYREVKKEKGGYINLKHKWFFFLTTNNSIKKSKNTQSMFVPVMGLSLLSTEEGLLISARNLNKSSSLSLSPS